jgi:hypothetical protein
MPAFTLLVANSASTALFGVVGESSAITRTPAFRAFAIAAFSAFASATVIRIPLTPAVVMFSIAAIWAALSELLLPAAYFSPAPSRFASRVAPSLIFTKNGFVTSFVIRPTWIDCAVAVGFAEAAATMTAAVTVSTSAPTSTDARRSGERF